MIPDTLQGSRGSLRDGSADSAPCYLARDNSSARPRILAMRVLPPFAFHVSILDISSGARERIAGYSEQRVIAVQRRCCRLAYGMFIAG